MVAITVILAGVITLWVFSISSGNGDKGEMFFFNTDLEASNNTVSIVLLGGSEPLDTSTMRVIIDGVDVALVPVTEMYAGDQIFADTGMEITGGTTYHIKIVINNKMMYEGDPVANP